MFEHRSPRAAPVRCRPAGGRRRSVAAVAVLGLLATACTDETGGSGGTAATTTPAPAAVTTAAPGAPAPTTAAAATTSPPASGGSGSTEAVAGPPRNPGDRYGDFGLYERVRFARGSSGATVSGGAPRGTVSGYLFGAGAGQKLTLNLISPNGVFDVFAPGDDTPLAEGVKYASLDSLPASGDYLVVISSAFAGGVGYDLITTITDPGATPGGSPQCNEYIEFDGDFPMRLCQQGDLVKEVQQGLKDLGYAVDVDGFFGPGTEAALRDYFDDGDPVLWPPDLEIFTSDEDP